MPAAVWVALKRSLDCKSEPSNNVHDPRVRSNGTRKGGVCGCGSSHKDVVPRAEKTGDLSPRSIGSNETVNPSTTHEVSLRDSIFELKLSESRAFQESSDVGNLRPGTPCPAATRGGFFRLGGSVDFVGRRLSFGKDSFHGSLGLNCQKCGEKFKKLEAFEAHHLSKHAVTQLGEEDSSRKVVEIICRTSLLSSKKGGGGIDGILKVHNTQKTLAQFEEYRDAVKTKAGKLAKKHPRCIADGNELLRFYGTTIQCSLGMDGSSGLCTSSKCSVCKILRYGFGTRKEENGVVGVSTTSTSVRAFESVDELHLQIHSFRKALIVCRVIAGRVHKPTDNFQEQQGFDSVAGKLGLYSSIEELYLLNPRALLPCFLVICKL